MHTDPMHTEATKISKSRSLEYEEDEGWKLRGDLPPINGGQTVTPRDKNSRVFLPLLSKKQEICPVRSINCYLDRTVLLRGGEPNLFLSFIKPHKLVTYTTIARWLRTVLEQAGISSKQLTGARSLSSKGSITNRLTRRHMAEPLLVKVPRIAWSKLQTTQLMCETEPSEI